MRDTLLQDIADADLPWLQDIEIFVSYDARLPLPLTVHHAIPVSEHDDIWQIWQNAFAQTDAVWLIAPEAGGVLARLTELVTALGKSLLGSTLDAVKLTSSKLMTEKVLVNAGIRTIPAYRFADWPREQAGPWVAKLDDGVGCTDSGCFDNADALQSWMSPERIATHIIQAYQTGVAASFSMLCKNGKAWLLSANQQKISLQKGLSGESIFKYSGSVINGMTELWTDFEFLANRIATAIPGLFGYIGVDVIVEPLVDSHRIHVVEINPRLTTSYVGLRKSIDHNPASLILDLFYNEQFQFPVTLCRNRVEIMLDD